MLASRRRYKVFRAGVPRAAVCVSLILLAGGAGCPRAATPDGCDAEPSGSFRVFLDSAELMPPVYTVRFSAAVLEQLEADDLGLRRLRLTPDADGVERTLAYELPGGSLPVRVGEHYDFQVDQAAGFPSASGILIRDARGLLFAAASDQRVGARVLSRGVPGFEVDVVEGGCESRRSDRCYESVRNERLRVRHAGESVELYHGREAMLGEYRVLSLTAQVVRYREDCADAGLVAVSYALVRENPER